MTKSKTHYKEMENTGQTKIKGDRIDCLTTSTATRTEFNEQRGGKDGKREREVKKSGSEDTPLS